MNTHCKYDRRAITKRAHELKKNGLQWGDAMRAAWAEAREANVPATIYAKAQPSGARAALRRYGVDMDMAADLAAKAVEAVKRVASEAVRRAATPAALPHFDGAIDARKGADGVYRF
ncbi:hypothetical protein LG047_15590 [Methylocystis sp. WRRC1]|uniref:hypothetical protein n=1 Tax=Methylocystis sp. WRRC1 TaxID=1732014 RepID=UPI001D147ABD|nr:hypothetical protein [Methylocystis sp. WRRC1]MCC3246723.1 hypothetical protein [Methylocystis sp. WRRC1]